MPQVEPYKAEHMRRMSLQPAQKYLTSVMTEEYMAALEGENVHSFALVDGDTVLGCAGLIPIWQGRALAWVMLAGEAKGDKFIYVHKAVKRMLDSCYINRIEATVDVDFPEGHRWMKMLGFKMEAENMRGYRPDGGSCALYARVLS